MDLAPPLPPPPTPLPLPPEPTLPERLALRVVQCGAIAIVFAASIRKAFELDRFLVPKDLVLHLTALIAGLLLISALRRIALGWIDQLLIIYLMLSALSALLATNRWLALRALAVSASGVLLFWIARRLRDAGLATALLGALALAIILVALTSLLQAYGLRTELFSLNRAPGGTLGNRNFIAHVAAIGLPLCMLRAVRGRRFALAGIALVCASLVLTRSRAAWLGAALMLVVFLAAALITRAATVRRLFTILVAMTVGAAAALVLPNTLHWRSDNPYLDSVTGVTNYQRGSGHGRLIQYQQSLRMTLHHPLLGAGPGNWAVEYPRFAAPNDPSMNDGEPGMTFNPWPSSDWVAFVSERGPVAAILLALSFLGIAFRAFKSDDKLAGAALLATLVAAGVVGMFDAVLLLPLPAFITWTAAGALMPPFLSEQRLRVPFVIVLVAFTAVAVARSAAQSAAMEIYATTGDRASLVDAAKIDPGNFRLRMRLARMGKRNDRCTHARAARGLFPMSAAARQAAGGCGD